MKSKRKDKGASRAKSAPESQLLFDLLGQQEAAAPAQTLGASLSGASLLNENATNASLSEATADSGVSAASPSAPVKPAVAGGGVVAGAQKIAKVALPEKGETRAPVAEARAPAAVAEGKVLSITEFTARAKKLLEGTFDLITVQGEISNFRRQASGHIYLTLKDAGSQLAAVLFRGDALRVRFPLRDGLQVVATGSISVYEPRGTYQLIVRTLEEGGEGRLRREFERLKQKLAAEGLFDRSRKRAVPPLPRVIGVVTSPTGAALQDFLRILIRRNWRGRVVVLPVRVQGAEAAGEVAAAVVLAAKLGIFDLLVVARGGGSLEDLWSFNEEVVARAVAASPVPVVSAIGHEIDFTLCDFAADVRAETPSAAAELVSSGYIAATERADAARQWLDSRVGRALEAISRRMMFATARLESVSPARSAAMFRLRLDDLRNRLRAAPALAVHHHRARLNAAVSRLEASSPQNKLRLQRARLEALSTVLHRPLPREIARRDERLRQALAALERAVRAQLSEHTRAHSNLGQRLRAVGVEETLRRGFALVRTQGGRLVTRADSVGENFSLMLQFSDGVLPAIARPKKS